MFRGCVDRSDALKMKNPELMLKNVKVEDWNFQKNKTFNAEANKQNNTDNIYDNKNTT